MFVRGGFYVRIQKYKTICQGAAGCFLLLFMGCHPSWAGIQVSPMMVSLDTHNQYVSSIKVLSDSQETQYIKVDIKKLKIRAHQNKKRSI